MYRIIIDYTDGSRDDFEDGLLFSGLQYKIALSCNPDTKEISSIYVCTLAHLKGKCPNCAVPDATYEKVDVSSGKKSEWWHCTECNAPFEEKEIR